MIPKIIHYCWFGGKEEPEDVKRCVASWKKFCPDYEIRRWDETNYDITRCKYMEDAYKAKKWAFVSDYARLDVLCEYGGLYMDTDVEMLRSFDDLLEEEMFCGFESRDPVVYYGEKANDKSVAFGLGFGAEAGHPYIKELIGLYQKLNFYNADGTMNLISCPFYQTLILKKHGLVANNETQRLEHCMVFSPEYFCPKSNVTDRFLYPTDRSYSIHHFTISWADPHDKRLWDMKARLSHYMPYWLASKIVTAFSRLLK